MAVIISEIGRDIKDLSWPSKNFDEAGYRAKLILLQNRLLLGGRFTQVILPVRNCDHGQVQVSNIRVVKNNAGETEFCL